MKTFQSVCFAVCLSAGVAHAQTGPLPVLGTFWDHTTRAGKLLRNDATRIRSAPEASDQHDICRANEARQIGRALYSCPRILEAFQMMEAFRLDISTVGYLRDAQSDVSQQSYIDANQLIALAQGRSEPAFDFALIVAHYHLAYLSHLHGDTVNARAHAAAVLAILEQTDLDLPASDLVATLTAYLG